MPANPQRDAIVIALDVGKSVSTLHDYEKTTFFKQARDCVSWIIQRKIISESKDVLSLILIGSEDSENPIAASGYENICVKFDFQLASWDMLKFIETEVKTTDLQSDWFGALIVSLEMLKRYEEYNAINSKKIVIFSDFTKHASDDLSRIAKTIRALDVEVTIIGPDHLHFSTYDDDDMDEPEVKRKKLDKNIKRQQGERIVYELWKKLPENIWICTFESALKQLCSYTPKSKRISYWNCIMDIGDVNINISVMKKTDPKPARKFNTKCIKPGDEDPGQSTSTQEGMIKSEKTAPTIKDTVMYYKHETGENNELVDVEVKPEDTIEGYRYGTTIVPFSEEDKSAMQYKSGPKSFSVIGFTHISNVPYYLLSGECSYVVLPRNKDKNAEMALSAIIQALKKIEFLGIVRRVYSDNRGLSLGILYPIVEEIFSDESDDVSYKEVAFKYLLFVELAFEDDLKSIAFPSLERVAENISQEQYNTIDSLIDKMDLMKADKGLRGEPCESFDLPYLHDFKEQFFHHCVIQRGLYPDKPLPTSLPPYIKNFIKIPKSVEENCKSVFEEIKKQFKIIKSAERESGGTWKQKKTTEHGGGDKVKRWHSGGKTEHFSESLIKEDPKPFNRTWMTLFAKGFPTDNEVNNVLSKYEELNETEKSKFLESFQHVITRLYGMYLKCNPDEYNQWMKRFKKYLSGEQELGSKIWEVIVSEFVGLITKDVNKYSKVTVEEAEKFLCEDIKPKTGEKEIPSFNFLDELQAEQNDIDFD